MSNTNSVVPARPTSGWLLMLAILYLTGASIIMLRPTVEEELSTGLIFALSIVIIGVLAGLIPAVLAALIAAITFNMLITEPLFFFRVTGADDLAPPVVFTACAIISGALSNRLRKQTQELRQTNLQVEGLFETSRLLQSAPDFHAISVILEHRTAELFGGKIDLFVLKEQELVSATKTGMTGKPLRLAADCLSGGDCVCLDNAIACRLNGTQRAVGAVVVTFPDNAEPDLAFVPALAGLVALAVERTQLTSYLADTAAEARMTKMKTALLSSVSHDLRTPLTAISAAASGLMEYREVIDEETSDRLLSTILFECGRLDRFTSNLLEMSRLEGGKEILRHETVSTSELVAACVDEMRRLAPEYHFRKSATSERDSVITDAALFELALMNILQNAVRYSEPATTITVAVTEQDGASVVTVTDEGWGVSAIDMPHIFKRFYRGTGRRVVTRGTGLGLTIAKAFVEFFDGSIRVASPAANGVGTCVELMLPLAEERA